MITDRRVTGGGAAPKNVFASAKIFRGGPPGRTRGYSQLSNPNYAKIDTDYE
jgi:hypothetical protein